MMSDPAAIFSRTALEVSRLVFVEHVDSTNTFIREREQDLGDFALVLSDHQTDGRGRLNRSWVGEKGETLAMSLLLPADLSGGLVGLLPLLVGASLRAALRSNGVDSVEMKWPNDILAGRNKLAGVLCEVLPSSAIVAGVGLNLVFRAEAPTAGAVSLATLGVAGFESVDLIVATWIATLRKVLDLPDQARHNFASENLGTLGREVEVEDLFGSKWRGTAESLRNDGALLVRAMEDESLREVVAADVHHLYQ
jgi:BirA family biotin operon repressor/biotin-[acetyl-CoA-carboxylase] ligase